MFPTYSLRLIALTPASDGDAAPRMRSVTKPSLSDCRSAQLHAGRSERNRRIDTDATKRWAKLPDVREYTRTPHDLRQVRQKSLFFSDLVLRLAGKPSVPAFHYDGSRKRPSGFCLRKPS